MASRSLKYRACSMFGIARQSSQYKCILVKREDQHDEARTFDPTFSQRFVW